MALPIGVNDLWKVFEWANGRRARKKSLVCEWLDEVYRDLEDLIKVWGQIIIAIEFESRIPDLKSMDVVLDRGLLHTVGFDREDLIENSSEPSEEVRRARFSQRMIAGRLREFYRSASNVVNGLDDREFRSEFSNFLGEVLQERDTLRKLLDEKIAVAPVTNAALREHLGAMKSALDRMQDEAASLQVMIKTFKAQD